MGGDIIGGIFGDDEQADAAKRGQDIQWDMFNQIRKDLLPFITAGTEGVGQLQEMVSQGPPTFEQYKESPYYDFVFDEGLRALKNQTTASQGGLGGGAYDKALMQYGQGMAATDFDRFRQQYFQNLLPYQDLANLGLNAASQSGAFGQNTASAVSALEQDIGQYRGQQWDRAGNLVNYGLAAFNPFGGASGATQSGAGLSSYQAYSPYPGAGYTTGQR